MRGIKDNLHLFLKDDWCVAPDNYCPAQLKVGKVDIWIWMLQTIAPSLIFIYYAKGQIISECPYEIIVSPKIPTKKFPRFLP